MVLRTQRRIHRAGRQAVDEREPELHDDQRGGAGVGPQLAVQLLAGGAGAAQEIPRHLRVRRLRAAGSPQRGGLRLHAAVRGPAGAGAVQLDGPGDRVGSGGQRGGQDAGGAAEQLRREGEVRGGEVAAAAV